MSLIDKIKSLFTGKAADIFNTPPSHTAEHVSPSGKWRLVVTRHAPEDGPDGQKYWSYSKGVIFEGLRQVAEVRRNYSSFPFAWIENHPDGKSYVICGADYQGQTVVCLDTGEVKDYIPAQAEMGHGFCWVVHHPSPDGTLLAVEGCYWACPYEVRIYDFSKPMEMPHPLLHRETDLENFSGWKDAKTCGIHGTQSVFSKPGHRLDGLTESAIWRLGKEAESELDAIMETDDYEWKDVVVSEKVWTCPEPRAPEETPEERVAREDAAKEANQAAAKG